MAITRRNYTPGQFETFTNEPVGTPVLNTWYSFQLDGLFSFDVANDVILYQGGSPIPSTAYDLSEDATYTAREASFTGLTLVKQFRITNATYAGIATVASGKNFGSAVDNDLAYTLYQNSIATQVIRTDYTGSGSLTTSTLYYSSLHVFDSLSADATFTIADGGGDERNRFTVKNDDGTYIVTVSGDQDYYVEPGQEDTFYVLSGALISESWSDPTKAKAWVNFNGTGTVAIRSSYNVASITDNGTGDYTINFRKPMANTNYAVIATGGRLTSVSGLYQPQQGETTVNSVRLYCNNQAATRVDAESYSVQILNE